MGVTLTGKQTALLAGDMQPKFLATISGAGEPNVVPVLSLCPYEAGKAAFAEFMLWKSKANLNETKRVALAALDAKLNFVTAHGSFGGFVVAGPLFEAMATQPMFRYNPYNGIRGAGSIDLEAVDAEGRIPMLTMLLKHLKAGRMAKAAAGMGVVGLGSGSGTGRKDTMPRQVTEKFGRLQALKALAWPVADGGSRKGKAGADIRVLPVAGVAPVGRSGLVVADKAIADKIPDGSRVAVAVITMEPVAYQVKGTARHWRDGLLIEVTEAYTAGPPVPGQLCSPAVAG